MSDIVNFKCVRIQSELDRYQRNKVIPHDLLEGTYSIDDIDECYDQLSKRHQRIASRLISAYTKNMQENLDSLRTRLRAEYASVTSKLETTHTDFVFPTIMVRYRSTINPVTAIHYETRELIKYYNSEEPRHEWLLGMLQDREFNNKILTALTKDIARLERIISRYYWPLHKLSDIIPLELLHARQLTTDFKHYITVFNSIMYWEPC